MGPIDNWTDAGFGDLVNLARRVSAAGSKLIVVDLPLPSWHANGVPYFQQYQRRKQPFIAELGKLDRVTYANMQKGFPDEEFYDSAHPRPKATWRWSERLTEIILKSGDTQ